MATVPAAILPMRHRDDKAVGLLSSIDALLGDIDTELAESARHGRPDPA